MDELTQFLVYYQMKTHIFYIIWELDLNSTMSGDEKAYA